MLLRQAINEAETRITRRDAETLLLHVLRTGGRDRAWLLAHPEAPLTDGQLAEFGALVTRRAGQEPLQYLTGCQEFFGLDLHVTPAVLIPRPETELLVESVLDWVATRVHEAGGRPLSLVDVGTGSGAIALALAKHLPHAEILALDLSPDALAVARTNATHLGLSSRVPFAVSDLLSALESQIEAGQRFDVVVSNPPYVPSTDAPSLEPQVRDYEPHAALFAGVDGLDLYRRLIPQARAALRPDGLLAMEFGFGQRDALQELLGGWRHVRFLDDLAGIPRVVLAELL